MMSTLGVIMSVPGQTMGVSVFTDYLIEALGLSRFELSIAYMMGTIGSSWFLPWGGRLFDRLGARAMAFLSTSLLGVSLIYLSQCDRVATLLSLGGLLSPALMGALAVFAGFMTLRFSGQGILAMTSRSLLGKWFYKNRGLVSGVSGMVVTFAFSAAPLGLDLLVQKYGWRGAWIVLAGACFMMAALSWLLVRDNPEECGLTMSGVEPEVDSENEDENLAIPHIQPPERDVTLEEAKREYAFWVFNMGLAAQALVITAVTFHIVSLGTEMGLSRQAALSVFLPMAVISTFANFISGWLCDRLELKYLLMMMLATLALGVFSCLYMESAWGRAMLFIGFGVSNGIYSPLMIVIWPSFFGRAHLGAISSLNLSIQVFASAIGPAIFGLSHAWWGSYTVGIYICAAIPLIILLSALGANNPQNRLASERS